MAGSKLFLHLCNVLSVLLEHELGTGRHRLLVVEDLGTPEKPPLLHILNGLDEGRSIRRIVGICETK